MLSGDEPALPVFDRRRYSRAARCSQLPYSLSLQALTLGRAELPPILIALLLASLQRSARLGSHTHTVLTQARRLALHEKANYEELETRNP